jgi:guanyl-specific ribonuclease Sa
MRYGKSSGLRGLTSFVLALLLALFVVGCGSKGNEASDAESQETVVESDTEVEDSSSKAPVKADAQSEDEDELVTEEAAEAQEEYAEPVDTAQVEAEAEAETNLALSEDGSYTSKDEVAWYLHTYGHLPPNYITKNEAEDAGWKTQGLSLAEACPGMSIGGGRFGNREKSLPIAQGRQYYECDIDYNGERSRNAKRLVYSNDGLIFYTEDHYKTFEQLY